jgi:general secretion pathway protein G
MFTSGTRPRLSPKGVQTAPPARASSGLTFIELVAVLAILLCISSVALPIGVNAVRRGKELHLRRALAGMRGAIDEYNKYAKAGQIQAWDPDWEMYPQSLDMLVEGVEVTAPNDPTPKTVTFLRAIPVDPMTGEAAWGVRSYQDAPDDNSTGGENVYDVYSLSNGVALDGTPYSSW